MDTQFIGHVDTISDEFVAGWAARCDAPEQPADVSLFINNFKVAQVAATLPRSDLDGKSVEGVTLRTNHGFRFDVSEIVPKDKVTRITVRFSHTGRIIRRGDAMIPSGAPVPPDFGANPPEVASTIPAPKIPRDIFRALMAFRPEAGLFSLLDRIDFDDCTSDEVLFSVFGGRSVQLPNGWRQDNNRETLNQLLVSDAFRKNLIWLFAEAFPEKRRDVFIHIPKCAGSDLTLHLLRRFPGLGESLRKVQTTPLETLLEVAGQVARDIRYASSFLIYGHHSLSEILAAEVLRPIDRAFTILRDPMSATISAINYILTRIRADLTRGEFLADSKGWLSALGLSDNPRELDENLLDELVPSLIRNRDVVSPNPMCRFLGGGAAEDVLERLRSARVEVTTTTYYEAWREQRWGVVAKTRTNKSHPFLRQDMLTREQYSVLQDITFEDIKLYDEISRRIDLQGLTSVRF